MCFVFFKQKTAYEMRISDWSSDVCSSDLQELEKQEEKPPLRETMIWTGNERGMKSHRILGLTLGKKGTLLAFTEARLDGSDEGPHDLVCKRSKIGRAHV